MSKRMTPTEIVVALEEWNLLFLCRLPPECQLYSSPLYITEI